MKTVIIGSGNVAYHLAKAFVQHNLPISQLFGRNQEKLQVISEELGIPYSTEQLEEAGLYLIAVSDNAIEEVSKLISSPKALVAHTSGSLPMEVLKGTYRKACFYPLQTFTMHQNLDYRKIPFFLEAEQDSDLTMLKTLADSISDNVMESSYEKRKYIHLTAVFACNFVNHLFARAQEIADSQEIPFSYFLPLIHETLDKINTLPPKDAQTGPAVRNDFRVLQLHEQLLQGIPLKIYKTMNQSIKEMYEL